jgi:hypothetical protein
MAGFQVSDDVVNRPGAEAATRAVGDIGCEPPLQRVALQRVIRFVAAQPGFGVLHMPQ